MIANVAVNPERVLRAIGLDGLLYLLAQKEIPEIIQEIVRFKMLKRNC
jgi:hypothetical protein